jgi:hypothetical protein
MAYLGAAPQPGISFSGVQTQSFNGNGSTVEFALSRHVAQATNLEVIVNNVQQSPFDGSYSVVGGYTLTFSEAPSSGTNNIYVVYRDYSVETVIDTGAVRKSGDTITGDLNFSGNGRRITGDFSNATIANRVMFQTSTVNSATQVSVVPNGTGTVATFAARNNSNPTDSGVFAVGVSSLEASLNSTINGTGTYLPMTFYTGGAERMRIDTSGRVTMPYQPAFLVQAVHSDTTYNSDTVVPWPNVINNKGSHFSTSTNRFTAPVTGTYFFSFTTWHNVAQVGRTGIRINGSLVGGSGTYIHARNGEVGSDTASLTCVLQLNANDYVDVYIAVGPIRMFFAQTFTGYLIG